MKQKTLFKRSISLALIVLVIFSVIPFTGFTKEEKDIKNTVTMKQIGGTLNYIKYTDGSSLIFPKNISSDGLPAYCLEQAKPNPPAGGITYTNGGTLDAGITYILKNGLHEYNQANRSGYLVGNDDYDFYITQTAIHIYNGLNDRYMTSSTGDSRILANVRRLVADARTIKYTNTKLKEPKTITASITPQNQELTLRDTGYFETNFYSITASGNYTNYRVIANNMPTEMEIIDINGNVVTNVDLAPNSQFKLRIRPEHVKSSIDVQLGVQVKYFEVVSNNWIPNNNTYQRMTKYDSMPTQETSSNLARATLTIGNLDIVKTSETGKVDGFKFNIKGNGIDRTEVTDLNGRINIANITAGKYTVTEVEVPNEFIVPNSQEVDIIAGQTATVNFNNILKKANIVGMKKNNTGFGLSGATIGLFKPDDTEFKNPLLTRETNEIGYFEFESVAYGNYIVKEIQAPTGYILSDKAYPVSVRENGVEVIVDDIINEIMKGEVKGIKTDKISGKPLSGAEIGLYSYTDDIEKGKLEESQVTGEDGLFHFKNIPYGKYYVQEIKSPNGFLLSDKKYEVDINKEGLVIDISIVNEPIIGKLELEYNKPNETEKVTGANPTTSDNSNIFIYLGLMLFALVTILFVVVNRKSVKIKTK